MGLMSRVADEGRNAQAPRRTLLVLVPLVGLLGLVAIGSTGHAQAGIGRHRPSYVVADTVGSLVLVLLVIGVGLAAWVLFSGRDYLVARRLEKRRRWWTSLLAFGVVVLVLFLPFARGLRHPHQSQGTPSVAPPPAAGSTTPTTAGAAYKPRFATAPVVLVLGLAGGVALAVYAAHRSRRRALGGSDDEASPAPTLSDVLDDTLDDLRAEPEPRRAVIAAYARLERTLGAFGLPRRPAEAPDEYLRRILVDLEVNSRFAQQLSQLFARAKFSQHSVDQAMKEEAIQLLVSIRTGLREADERAEHQALIDKTLRRATS